MVCSINTNKNTLTLPIARRLLGQVLQIAHLTDAVHPVVHVQLRFGGQIERAARRLHVEHVLELLLAMLQPQAAVDLLALVQIDDALQLATAAVRVVFETVLAGYFALLQREPAAAPALRREMRFFVRVI